MSYILDMNICIYFVKGTFEPLLQRMKKARPADVKIPSIEKAELLSGIEKSEKKKENALYYGRFMESFGIVPFDDAAAPHYARIRVALESKGKLIGPNDLIIASIALAHNGTLVTHDTAEFSRVSGLPIEGWTQSK
jgi:tRNA(fMet)-specific endonuclease VapC